MFRTASAPEGLYSWRLYRCRGCGRELPRQRSDGPLLRHVSQDDRSICVNAGPHKIVYDPAVLR